MQTLMQPFIRQGFCEQDLQNTLAKLLCGLKNPYVNTQSVCETVNFSTTLPDSSVKLEVTPNPKQNHPTLNLHFVHILFTPEEHISPGKLRLEALQFNRLMEKVLLPVFIWENKKSQQFELHWQEQVALQFNSSWIWSVFEQSLSLASAFKGRLTQQKTNRKMAYYN